MKTKHIVRRIESKVEKRETKVKYTLLIIMELIQKVFSKKRRIDI